ncbi:tRNA (adenosine(37)-N6)-threonylcarbamoyltransferase complex dimerization subunit type 1 TsaB [Salipiger mangrovisoli]|uniref:tRNA (Adenosine(37)-N6)-threonylcarbamoyltransferase complex dimerization subunit type 1 TsaB n=1 Tax=Salipiger mangrovisoli TaxID=2865933 RepID=A0ABR9X1E9_9RHOB|nr:tRNA (adenosine(37)-N6)-threonylcarbamoyltransferase complex dimerization subunit type 1 TsaB [Salipiger mangrovisoli]MBE9637395.1 tRNA (adenosine(37)-N6)-threonylcarbamoyltransferase complex dimerization subunit type 1 TsaB [Salipiger mangrovisoli]
MSDLLILAFDTSAAHCAAALLRGDAVLAARAEEMGRGQAERLMPLLEEVLAEGGASWDDLDRIAVGVGPGNFTGIRISVSTARGLALGLGRPAVGVSTFEAIHLDAPEALAGVPAPRGQIYVQRHLGTPELLPAEGVEVILPPEPRALAVCIARAAARKEPGPRPAPLYIRPADAAPSRDAAPRLLD